MTSYSLWQAGTGSGTAGGPLVSYTSTPIIVTNLIAVSGGGLWFEGYYVWVPTAGDTAPSGGYKCAIYSVTTTSTATFVPGSNVISTATMTANAWNFIPLATPLQVAPGWDKNLSTNGSLYIICIGWVPSAGFPDSSGWWGSAPQDAGVSSGQLYAYGTSGAGFGPPYTLIQGLFSTAGSDPSVTDPLTTGSVSAFDNFWVDCLISTTAPGGYSGSYRLWPGKYDANPVTGGDQALNFTVSTEIDITGTVTLNNVWYFSPNGTGSGGTATTLATRCDVWNISTGLSVASITSPSWLTPAGGAASAGTGWVKAAFAGGTTLGTGSYRVSIFNANGTTDAAWNPKDGGSDYWGETLTGVGAAGIAAGPLSAPAWSAAQSGYIYASGSPGATPPYSGATTAHAQPPFGLNPGGTIQFPQLYAPIGGSSNEAQNYWVDLEVTPQAATGPQHPAFAYVMRRT